MAMATTSLRLSLSSSMGFALAVRTGKPRNVADIEACVRAAFDNVNVTVH